MTDTEKAIKGYQARIAALQYAVKLLRDTLEKLKDPINCGIFGIPESEVIHNIGLISGTLNLTADMDAIGVDNLVEALRFYAGEDNWNGVLSSRGGNLVSRSLIKTDKGAKAREALAAFGEVEA